MTTNVVRIRGAAPADEAPWGDEAVAHACASRDPAAISELFDRFRNRVARYLSRAVGANAEVEDLVQITFLEIAQGKARFDGRSSVTTWLLGIATNVARHHLRSRSRRFRLLRAVKEVSPSQIPHALDETADARRLLLQVERLLGKEAPERRLAFVLCELEGVPARDAASMLNTTETAVWKRVSDVRRAVRTLLEGTR
ncbi:MAG TPA: RNA polymerase sigma factor [Polyangiaceae bacterium]|jgi:RNA polymerase sigma-70 factor (ECF subfamily)|nr:RNA polymerase sigma factor [Polyangiaceae bacterium]